jgi:deoxyribodipyrimidine photo-lyase
MAYYFPTDYPKILERIWTINPVRYAKTRNFLDGAVTYLSPYISRGVISVKQVWEIVQQNGYTIDESEKFIHELAWREYFQRVWQSLEDDMFEDIRRRYTGIRHTKMPAALEQGTTGIEAIDEAIRNLYSTGYMHNHLRMYTASIACNIGKAHWQAPSQWMYYHLLDGDLASNTCSWQWVAGTFSSKQYYCNQENINKYAGTVQQNTFLDKSYDELPVMDIPIGLKEPKALSLKTNLPDKSELRLDFTIPLLLYTSYNLDPSWKKDIKANRVLVLEPSHFEQFPVSDKVINFIMALSNNIKDLQILVGQVSEIPSLHVFPVIYSKEHPAFKHFPGVKEERDWLFPEVKGFHNSFFSFWKKCERMLKKKQSPQLKLL